MPRRGAARYLFLLISVSSYLHGQVLKYVESGTSNSLRAIEFVDDSVGIIVGDGGTILRTTNGGEHWNLSQVTTANLRSISFGTSTNAVVVGSVGTILRTTDAGITWKQQNSGILVPLYGVSSHDSLNAVAVGANGAIVRTSDGGASWQSVSSGLSNPLFNVAHADSGTVIAIGSAGSVLRSTDKGNTWERQAYSSSYLYGIRFHDVMNGTIVGDNGAIMQTTNGGVSWSFRRFGARYETVFIVDLNHQLAAGMDFALTTNGGVSWSLEYSPMAIHGVHMWDSTSYIGIADQGVILRSYPDTFIPPKPVLSEPANGAMEVPLVVQFNKQLVVTLRWRSFYPYTPRFVHIQVSTDSTFNGPLHFERIVAGGYSMDTVREVSQISPFKKYYWRVQSLFSDIVSPWSDVYSFKGSVAQYVRTIRDVQEVSAESLVIADSLQNSITSRWRLQATPLEEQPVVITGFCTAPAASLQRVSPSAPTFFVQDTSSGTSSWSGLRIEADPFATPSIVSAFESVRTGDVIVMAGDMYEDNINTMNSATILSCYWMAIIDSNFGSRPLNHVKISEFFVGGPPGSRASYSTAEQYEGEQVRFTNLTVHSVNNMEGGTINLSDGSGSIISTSDLSHWFTLRAHRDSSSTYSVPGIGTHIDSLTGVITTINGSDNPLVGQRYRIAPVFPGDIVLRASSGTILGSVYEDANRNGMREQWERGVSNWSVVLSGKVSAVLSTDSIGVFSLAGLDSGWYTIRRATPTGWGQTTPDSSSHALFLASDSLAQVHFGIYYQWNSISGVVFNDLDENGVRDSTEPGLPNWCITLRGETIDSVFTDSSGKYLFSEVGVGVHDVTAMIPLHWEKVSPAYQSGYEIDFHLYDQHLANRNFGVHTIPPRVRIPVTVSDDSVGTAVLRFGVRPGASYGIWGVSPLNTNQDFSEGEFEIPPRVFGIFDARFEDPHLTQEHFGQGAWTDMRPFVSSAQVDTYRIRFQPAYLLGGDYPMKLEWSPEQISQSYLGPVEMVEDFGLPVNMKSQGLVKITNSASSTVMIVASQPVLQVDAVVLSQSGIPRSTELYQNYPNPFNPRTTLRFSLSSHAHVQLAVFNVLGKEVASIVDETLPPGTHAAEWDASAFPSGVYFYRLATGQYTAVKKMLLLR